MRYTVVELVYRTHTEGKEKAVLMRDYIANHKKPDYNEDIAGTLDFFYKHIPLHFAYEEVVIRALLKARTLTEEEAANFNKILEEHKPLLANFENLSEMAEKIDEGGIKQKEAFFGAVNDTIYYLIKHAEFEDEYLFPVAEIKITDKLTGDIEKEISRIVF
jgi:hemerythrin-like domain-containing protein